MTKKQTVIDSYLSQEIRARQEKIDKISAVLEVINATSLDYELLRERYLNLLHDVALLAGMASANCSHNNS